MRMHGAAQRNIVAVNLISSGTAEDMTVISDQPAIDTFEESGTRTFIAGSEPLCSRCPSTILRMRSRRPPWHGDRARVSSICRPLKAGDMGAFAVRRIPTARAGIVPPHLDDPGPLRIMACDPVEAISAQIHETPTCLQVAIENREAVPRPVFRV